MTDALDETGGAADTAFWRSALDGLEPLEPPLDRPRPTAPEAAPAVAGHTVTVPARAADALRKAAAELGVGLPVALLAAYRTVLGRWARKRDVAVGVPVDGNLVVVRTELRGDGFAALTARVDAAVREARAHAATPFAELAAALGAGPERSGGHHPLVQAVFGAAADGYTAPAGYCPPDLALSWADDEEAGLRLRLHYRTALFTDATAERFAGSLLTLLAGVCDRPGAALADLDIVPAEELATLEAWGRNAAAYPTGGTVAGLFAVQAARTPDAVAVVFGAEEVTYRELDARAGRLARHLRGLGVDRDVPVGVCLERGTELVVALLAVLKAGGAYVPLDPEHPVERLAFVLADTSMPVVVTQESLRDRLAGEGRVLVAVDTDRTAIEAHEPETGSLTGAGPDDLAYVLYTSGSTGTPKGVAVTVGSLVNLLYGMRDTFPAPQSERVLFTTSATFDIAGVEVFLPLITGGRVIGATREQVHTPRALAELIDRHAVTLAQATPSAWRPLLDALGDTRRELTVFTAGEALPAELAARMLRAGRRVVNGYGPTETTVYATLAEITEAAGPVPIGRPSPNTELSVVDEHGRRVPVGVPGELLIGGAGVARGYLGRPDLTAERFADGVYRTGDLVRWLPDGSLDFLGRLDHQVKVRGFRIELGEIEAALLAHAEVSEAVVAVRDDAVPGERALVAYCVPAAGRTLGVTALREWCGRTLPGYMVPAVFVFLDALPLTGSGKTDRTALPAPDGDRSALEAAFVAPRNAAERAVARAWAEALWADEVGAHDDFFELGGDSLVATRVALKLQDEFGLEIPVRVLFSLTTVESLAQALMTVRRGGDWPAA
ncbi:amino acid adenylation domain-containing protein [Streptomyces sp. NPDC004327]|uniref:non-ribosomal peptide synthetase n=1 Tax=Streptomyces sp. NPDC004327 TaxID=3364699 RepID=UPI0036A1F400